LNVITVAHTQVLTDKQEESYTYNNTETEHLSKIINMTFEFALLIFTVNVSIQPSKKYPCHISNHKLFKKMENFTAIEINIKTNR
jgi:hypothetical protein